MTPTLQQQLLRWRLVLGQRAEGCQCGARGGPACACGIGPALSLDDLASAMPETDTFGLDGSLEMVYRERGRPTSMESSQPNIPRWLGDIRRYFPQDVVAMIQKDAIERRGMKE